MASTTLRTGASISVEPCDSESIAVALGPVRHTPGRVVAPIQPPATTSLALFGFAHRAPGDPVTEVSPHYGVRNILLGLHTTDSFFLIGWMRDAGLGHGSWRLYMLPAVEQV